MPFAVSSANTGSGVAAGLAWRANAAGASMRLTKISRQAVLRMDLFHSHFRAQVVHDARSAARIHGLADVLTPGHEIEIDLRPVSPRHDAVQRLLGLVGHSRLDPAQPV